MHTIPQPIAMDTSYTVAARATKTAAMIVEANQAEDGGAEEIWRVREKSPVSVAVCNARVEVSWSWRRSPGG